MTPEFGVHTCSGVKLPWNFHIQPKRRPLGQKVTKKLNVMKLKKALEFQEHMHSHLSDLRLNQSSIEDQWATFRDTTHSATLECLGPVTRNYQDWFDKNDMEIQKLLAEKHHLLRDHQNDVSCKAKKAAFTSIRSTAQARLRHMQDSWLSAKANEIQSFADRHDTKRLYDAL